MSKPDDVSQEAWKAAQDICDEACLPERYYTLGVLTAMQSSIARAIDAAKAEQRWGAGLMQEVKRLLRSPHFWRGVRDGYTLAPLRRFLGGLFRRRP